MLNQLLSNQLGHFQDEDPQSILACRAIRAAPLKERQEPICLEVKCSSGNGSLTKWYQVANEMVMVVVATLIRLYF
jgi:hypothetical protein